MLPLKNIKFFKIEILYMETNDQGDSVSKNKKQQQRLMILMVPN